MSNTTFYDCREAFKRLGDFLDHELTPDEIALVEAHLQKCEHCAIEFKFEEALLEELKAKARSAPAPAGLRESVLRTLDQVQTE